MTEQLVTFETAKLAKDKGFNWPTDKSYSHSLTERVDEQDGTSGPFGWKKGETNVGGFFMNNSKYDRSNTNWYNCSAPTQALLQKWLFKVHSIWVESTPVFSSNEMLGVNVRIFSWKFPYIDIPYDGFDVYEGLEMGLQEALRLIK